MQVDFANNSSMSSKVGYLHNASLNFFIQSYRIDSRNTSQTGNFYSDFRYDKVKDTAIKLKQIPRVDEDRLKAAIPGFEDIIKSYG
jgi:hypothetical protein